MKFRGTFTSGALHENPIGYPENVVMIKGVIQQGNVVQWFAADPPTKRYSGVGSCLAYPSPSLAISGRNCGVVDATSGVYTFVCEKPNTYYANGGSLLLPPHIVIRVWDRDQWIGDDVVVLDTMLAGKELTYSPHRTGPEFYQRTTRVLTQQQLLEERCSKGEVSVRQYAEGHLM